MNRVHPYPLLALAAAIAVNSAAYALPESQLGPSSQRTPITITEIHYHPRAASTDNFEFVELRNTEPVAFDLGGFRLAGDMSYQFATDSVLPALSVVVVAADPNALATRYGITNALGPFTGALPDSGGTVSLVNRWGAELLKVPYDDDPPWPTAADGGGHSLVLARPDYGEASPLAWKASRFAGGSPGVADPTNRSERDGVMFNEILAHTDPDLDKLELYNSDTQSVDLSGCAICDEPQAQCLTLPPGTSIASGGFLGYTEIELGYRLSSQGDDLFLMAPDGTNVIDAVRFGSQQRGISLGRYPDGAPGLRRLAEVTIGASNTPPRQDDIVISEIMFRPLSGLDADEYVELANRGASTVDLSAWRFTDGISFTFPNGTTLNPGGYLVVAKDRARLISRTINLNAANTLGDYAGSLADSGERLALARPDNPSLPRQDFVVVDEVTYGDGGEWGQWIDGEGSSLELTDLRSDNDLAANWAGSDETAKSQWTTIETTGILEQGSGTMEELNLFLPQKGEALVDNIELVRQDETDNRVAPSTFEVGLDGWTPLGNHVRTTRETTGGDDSPACLHLRASGAGRTTTSTYELGNLDRVRAVIPSPPSVGQTFRLRARARWLAGWPYLNVSLKGFWLEAAGRMHVPENLGTPGLVNSRSATNAPPAVWNLEHEPLLPAPGEAVTVRCQAVDPDGIAVITLFYRIDPSVAYTNAIMRAEGPGGTGRYAAVIPGQTNGVIVGFYVTARDLAVPGRERAYPSPDLARNALIRFGETSSSSVFQRYTYWVSDANVRAMASRSNQSNEPVDATLVYNGVRAIYNADLRYRGNYRRFISITDASYALTYSNGDPLLGVRESKLDIPSIQFPNGTRQQERHAYDMATQVGHPSSYLRFVRVHVNGSDLFRHDIQTPTRDFAASWYGDDDAHMYKEDYPVDPFGMYTNTGGGKHQATYAFVMQKSATSTPANDFEPLYRLADALAQTNTATRNARVDALADARGWAGYFVGNHAVGNEDSYGYGPFFLHNMYGYIPPVGRSRLHLYDMDSAFTTTMTNGLANILPGPGAPLVQRLFRAPSFERIYWRVVQDFANGPMVAAASDARLYAWYAAFTNDGLPFASPDVGIASGGTRTMRQWIEERRAQFIGALAVTNADVPLAFTSNGGADFSSTNAIATLAGVAPVRAETLRINGLPAAVTWTSPTAWQVPLGLRPGANLVTCEGLDRFGTIVGTDTITVTSTGAVSSPLGSVVFSELMYHPTGPGASFIELFNHSPDQSFELGGCHLEGVDFVFPRGSVISPGGFLVVAESIPGYAAAYTNAEVLAGAYSGSLDNGGERLRLRSPAQDGDAVLDEVYYGDSFPWPTAADGRGCSLQRLNPSEDGRHPGAWQATNLDTNRQWTFVSVTGQSTDNPRSIGGAEVRVCLQSTGSLPIDDVRLVTGAVPGANPNLLANGGFESGTLQPWSASGNHARSAPTTTVQHGGTNALAVVATGRGNSAANAVRQSVALAINTTYTLSYWYYPVDGVDGVTVDVTQTGIRSAHAVAPAPPAAEVATPGRPNSTGPTPPPLPDVWINELAPSPGSAVDNLGEAEPWIELWNAGTTRVDLAGLYLGESPLAPLGWAFPPGSLIEPTAHLLVWADAETNETAAGALHAGLRLSATGGVIVLAQAIGADARILDAASYEALAPGFSYGAVTEADPSLRQVFTTPTPGLPNSDTAVLRPLRINEWMANNSRIPDPADQLTQDWFELFNPNAFAVSLAGYRLTDTPGTLKPFIVPDGIWVPGAGFLLVWADGEPGQTGSGGDLHVDFKLDADGDTIQLFSPSGSPIDQVSFSAQRRDATEGLWPDGATAAYPMLVPTPGASNRVLSIRATSTASNAVFRVEWHAASGSVYRLEYADLLAGTNWSPLGVVTAAGPTATLPDPGAALATQRFYRVLGP